MAGGTVGLDSAEWSWWPSHPARLTCPPEWRARTVAVGLSGPTLWPFRAGWIVRGRRRPRQFLLVEMILGQIIEDVGCSSRGRGRCHLYSTRAAWSRCRSRWARRSAGCSARGCGAQRGGPDVGGSAVLAHTNRRPPSSTGTTLRGLRSGDLPPPVAKWSTSWAGRGPIGVWCWRDSTTRYLRLRLSARPARRAPAMATAQAAPGPAGVHHEGDGGLSAIGTTETSTPPARRALHYHPAHQRQLRGYGGHMAPPRCSGSAPPLAQRTDPSITAPHRITGAGASYGVPTVRARLDKPATYARARAIKSFPAAVTQGACPS